LVMTKNRGESLKRKAEELNDRQMHDKIGAHLGQDMDLVAVDVKYHPPCVNAYLKKTLGKTSLSGKMGRLSVLTKLSRNHCTYLNTYCMLYAKSRHL